MKLKNLVTLVGVIGILVLGGVGFMLIRGYRATSLEEKAGRRDMSVAVQVKKVGRAKLDEIVSFNGDIQALQNVELKPRISGRLLTLALEDGTLVEEGTRVQKGQLIGTIDDRDLKAALDSAIAAKSVADAAVAVAKASVRVAEVSLEDKKREMNRQERLLEQKSTTSQTYDLALTAYQEAEANLERSKAALVEAQSAYQQATANEEMAQVNFSETKLYSPMNGIVSRKYVDPGAMVSPTTSIVTIEDIDVVKVLLSVPVVHLPRIVPGVTTATMQTVSLPGKEIPCVMEKVYPAIDMATRTASVELRIENKLDERGAYQLLPGMFSTVHVTLQSKPDALALASAIPIRNLERNVVYRVKEDNTVEGVDVKLGVRYKDMVEILDGLSEGDTIVVVGQHRLTDGASIRIIEGNNLAMPQK